MVYALFYKNLQVTFMANFQLSWPRDMGYREQLGDEEESLILLKESVYDHRDSFTQLTSPCLSGHLAVI